MKIPRVMSTQHPDNVLLPFFAERQDMSGEDEIQEAYYAFSHLGCDEQMWDCDGKEVDDFVIRKLFTKYGHYFKKTRLGEDVFLTLRVLNPDVEKREAKVLIETLESIPRQCDASTAFYGEVRPPIFEVILPMTMSAESLNRVYYYGAGSPPFRGHLTPETVEKVLEEYPDVQTFTVQSAFKYDNPVSSVISAIAKLKSTEMTRGYDIDEARCIEMMEKVSNAYRVQVESIADLINYVATFVPKRRMRKLHVGLFGYARSMGKVSLPRVIAFCAACYSIGLPPEILGLSALTKEDLSCMNDLHVNFNFDIRTSLSYFNEESLSILPPHFKDALRFDWIDYETDKEHKAITSRIIRAIRDNDPSNIQSMLIEAAHIRRFLG